MKTIILASSNPVKINATRRGFERMFPGESLQVKGMAAPSGVSSQPLTSSETLLGAENRSQAVSRLAQGADFWVGIEGGVEEIDGEMAVFAWVVVRSGDQIGRGCTGLFFLPEKLAALVHQGIELGEADDIIFNRQNSKQRDGAVGILTDGVIDRTDYYEHAVILALIPFTNPALYQG